MAANPVSDFDLGPLTWVKTEIDHSLSQARESLDVVTVIFANRAYQILRMEFAGVGAGTPGQKALDMLNIDRPTLDFVALAKGMGVLACRVDTVDAFGAALASACREKGPQLIEVVL